MIYNAHMIKWTVLLLLLVPGSVLAQDAGERPAEKKTPSLAELARQSRQRSLEAKTPARRFTNADLARLQGANVSTSSGPAPVTAESPDESVEGGESESGLSPEELEKWRKAFEEARLELQKAVNEGLVLQLRMNNLRNAFLRQSDGATQQRVQAQLQETFDRIEANKREQRQARDEIAKLQREARAAGLSRDTVEQLTGQLPSEPPDILSDTTRDSGQ